VGKKKKRYTYDRHALYETAVQSVDYDVEFIERVYEGMHGGKPRRLREDFCGSAALASHWVRHHPENEAWGVDLDAETLDWGRRHRVAPLGDAADRVHLSCADVLATRGPKVEVQVALNFSYCIFKQRAELRRYFKTAHRLLEPGGIFVCDLIGGTETVTELKEKTRRKSRKDPDGRIVPALTYIWEQEHINAVDNHFVAHITLDFERKGKKRRLKRAFTYDWRLWGLPEIRDLLDDAGFELSQVYAQDDDGDYHLTHQLSNDGGWLVYVVARKAG